MIRKSLPFVAVLLLVAVLLGGYVTIRRFQARDEAAIGVLHVVFNLNGVLSDHLKSCTAQLHYRQRDI
jgi:hypothetical protein